MSEKIILSVSASNILAASKAGIREEDWRKRLNELGGKNVRCQDGAILCDLPQEAWVKAKTNMEKFARGNLFPDAMGFEKTPGVMIIQLNGMCSHERPSDKSLLSQYESSSPSKEFFDYR